MPIRDGTYFREPDGALLLYHSDWFYTDAAVAFVRDTNKNDFSLVTDKEELKKYAFLKPGEYDEYEQ